MGDCLNTFPKKLQIFTPHFALMHARYLPPTPSDPQVTFSIQSLELLHSLFCAASTFSIQSFSHFLTDMRQASSLLLPCTLTQNHVASQVIYQSHLKTQISIPFNISAHTLRISSTDT